MYILRFSDLIHSVMQVSVSSLPPVVVVSDCSNGDLVSPVVTTTATPEPIVVLPSSNDDLSSFSRSIPQSMQNLHAIFGHLSTQVLRRIINNPYAVNPIPIPSSSCDVTTCSACLEGGARREPVSHHVIPPSSAYLDRIDCDLHEVGTLKYRLDGGENHKPAHPFILFIVDHATRFSHLYPLASKSDVSDTLQSHLLREQNLAGKHLKLLVCDSGSEFLNSKLTQFLQSNGTKLQPSPPHSHEINGLAERRIQEISRISRIMLIHAGMDRRYYSSALLYANETLNSLPNSLIKDLPPSSCRLKHLGNPKLKVDLSRFHVFGSRCWILDPKGIKSQLARAEPGVFLGFDVKNGYPKYLKLETGAILVSRNITYQDDIFPLRSPRAQLGNEERSIPISCPIKEPEVLALAPKLAQSSLVQSIASQSVMSASLSPTPSYAQVVMATTHPAGHQRFGGRGKRATPQINGGLPPRDVQNFIFDDHSFCFHANDNVFCSANLSEIVEPTDATTAPWDIARATELRMMQERGTFSTETIIPPPGSKVLRTKFVYTKKISDSGIVHKARLVALGFTQRAGVDFHDTYSPVVHLPTVRLVTALSAQLSLKSTQIDVLSAYLNAKIKETLYIKLPDGRIVKLIKAIYGLKQAGREWYNLLSSELQTLGYSRSINDKCLFFKIKGKSITLFPLHVDDMRISSNDTPELESLISHLHTRFGVRRVKNNVFLGMQFTETDSSINISQSTYILKLLREFQLVDCNPVPTPMIESGAQTLDDQISPVLGEPYLAKYREGVGALLFLANATRPDISQAVGVLSRSVKSPTNLSWTYLLRIFKYLKGTINKGIIFNRKPPTQLTVYTDASYGGNQANARSTSGVIIQYGGPIQWRSIRQKLVTKSSSDAEIVALLTGIEDSNWLQAILSELGHNKMISIYCDNAAAVQIANNEHAAAKAKHMNVRYQLISEAVTLKKVKVLHIPGTNNPADMLTKPLGPIIFNKHFPALMGNYFQ